MMLPSVITTRTVLLFLGGAGIVGVMVGAAVALMELRILMANMMVMDWYWMKCDEDAWSHSDSRVIMLPEVSKNQEPPINPGHTHPIWNHS